MTMIAGGLGIAELAEIEETGRDGQGTLYAATDLKLARRVAVRLFSPLQNEVDRERFAYQAKLLGRFSAHPNVVNMYSTGFTEDHAPYFVMELVGGPHLDHYLQQRGPLPWAGAVELAMQICTGLDQAHRAGVIHRDLRPENVLMAGTIPKLSGFLLPVFDRLNPPTTANDAVLGAHQPPESLSGAWDERSDLYSLASILHQAIDGQPPTRSGPQLAIAGLPPALAIFIAAALSPDPLDRPQTAAEFADELRVILEGRTTGSLSLLHAKTQALPAVSVPSASQPMAFAGGPQTLPAEPGVQPPPGPSPVIAAPWAPPMDWAPPDKNNTAVFDTSGMGPAVTVDRSSDSSPRLGPNDPVPPGAMPPVPNISSQEPERSPLFYAAVALLVLSLVGFLAVIANATFNSGDADQAGPVLPDPDAVTVVQADGSVTIAPSADGEAMAESTTTIEAMEDQSPTTETTVARVTVPNLIGEPVEAATKALTDAGFQVLVVGRRTANAQPGTVTQQKPDAGDVVTLPLSVTLYIPKASNLPPMVGRSADSVCLELQALGLICNRVNQNSDQIPAGSVIATNPVEGALFSEGSSVALTVSTGPVTNITIPEIAKTSRAEAETVLRELGFTTIAFAMRPSETPKGQVFGSNPPAGSILASNRPITILISTGQASMATMPDVVGLTIDEANTLLADAALNVEIATVERPAGDPEVGRVIASTVAAGTEVEVGTTVILTVGATAGDTAPTTTVPDSSTTTTATDTTTETTVETTTTTVAESTSSTEANG